MMAIRKQNEPTKMQYRFGRFLC